MNQTAWSLNGVWQVVTDDELQGRALHWERHSALLNRPDVRAGIHSLLPGNLRGGF